ncbi:aldo/keto reductase [Haloplasma contractile]|uniref:1-deoxy-D-xylulose-5-phosphate reductoisomerase protein n=1 Tax=Haloplasma contractile SSD-17B TaxID=1033810 RepID=U2FKL9_9MOLU|nr:aldo/keto reductase [Haloplasma contractile]ERJ13345.1 1-deoxy-D-xylulose-5-phosphate reductoisomerase protein [Haloplasma contractile SSD-17B]
MKKVNMKPDVNNSLLGFGCMRFPTTEEGKIDREQSIEMLDCSYQNGLNHFDTAAPYHGGESEEFMGDYLKKYSRDSFTVSTKLPVWEVKEYDDFEKILDRQLNKLQLEYIDFYLLHALNKDTWKNIVHHDVFKFIKEAQAKGKFKYIGFSFHDDLDLFKEIANSYDWDFSLMQLNYMDQDHQQGMTGYEMMTERNIPVWVMEPIKGGKLANLADDLRDKLDNVTPGDHPAKWALRWCASLPNVKLILSGMSTLEQVKQNCDTFSSLEPLNQDEQAIIEEVRVEITNRLKVDCTACNYCMPCPEDINIPHNFTLFNESYMYNNKKMAENSYQSMSLEKQAISCIACGKCLEQCPQKIDIPAQMQNVADYFA